MIADISENSDADLENIISSSRFKLIEEVGRGAWGVVYKAKDNTRLDGKHVAIKLLDPSPLALKQMEHRKQSAARIMQREQGAFRARKHVVPRHLITDNAGRDMIVMPFYDRFLSDVLRDDSDFRRFVGSELDYEVAIGYLLDIAKGLDELHEDRVAHGDIKPDNLAIESAHGKETVLINDLGTTTCATLGRTISPRDNIGFLYARAPEQCKKDGHPSTASDAFAFGSLAFRMFTGKYLLEDLLNSAKKKQESPEEWLAQTSYDQLQKIIDDQLSKYKKNIPRNIRYMIQALTKADPHQRDTGSLEEQLDDATTQVRKKNLRQRFFDKWTLRGALWLGGTSALAIATLNITSRTSFSGYERIGTVVKLSTEINAEPYRFVREEMILPYANFIGGAMSPDLVTSQQMVDQSVSKGFIPQDRRQYVGLLSYTHQMAAINCSVRVISTKQHDLFEEMHSVPSFDASRNRNLDHGWLSIHNAINVGLDYAKQENGTYDLEDVVSVARVGVDTVNRAKEISGSSDYQIYRTARDTNGVFIIPETEQKFINTWLAFIR